MMCERTFKNRVLIFMRKFGFIRKKKYMKPMKVRTINMYPRYSSIKREQHVFIVNKLSVKKNCSFNVETKNCKCGAGLEEFILKKCN